MSPESKIIQYCGFKISGEEYAIPVMDVQEVVKPQQVTPIPLAQEVIRGLVNLRGQIVTCLSLRKLFGKDDDLGSNHMNIIIKSQDGLFSLVVDEVTDIIDVDFKSVENVPETLNGKLKNYVNNIYKREKGLVILLDVERIINLKS